MRWHWVMIGLCGVLIFVMGRELWGGPAAERETPPAARSGFTPAVSSAPAAEPVDSPTVDDAAEAPGVVEASAPFGVPSDDPLAEVLANDPYNEGALRELYARSRDAGEIPTMVEAARRILVMAPDDLDFAFAAVAELGRVDQWRAAVELLETLRPRHDESAAFWLNLATAARAAGRYSQAVQA